ncbi:YggT family protein [bacterium]|nr:YggT family protein [bacterium]
MAKLIRFLYRLINYYLYFVVMACFLALVPNINPNYPLFNYIFKIAGFYFIPPIFGFIISPMLVMIILAIIMMGLDKIYTKYYAPKEPKVLVMTPEQFIEQIKKNEQAYIDKVVSDVKEEFSVHEQDENTSEGEDKKE